MKVPVYQKNNYQKKKQEKNCKEIEIKTINNYTTVSKICHVGDPVKH